MKHNDYDYLCAMWYGDRSPDRNIRWFPGWRKGENKYHPAPLIHREMNGTTVRLSNQRCSICNPYTEDEANPLLEPNYVAHLH